MHSRDKKEWVFTEDMLMKLQYTSPEMVLVCLQPAQKLADATIPYDNMNDPDYVGPGSWIFGGTEIEMPIK